MSLAPCDIMRQYVMTQFVDGGVEVNLKYQSVAKLTAIIHDY